MKFKNKNKRKCTTCRFSFDEGCRVGTYYADKGQNKICYEGELWESRNHVKEEEKKKIKEQLKVVKKYEAELEKAFKDFKKHPEKFKSPKYITEGDDKVAVIHERDGIVVGVIVESPLSAFIGFVNSFIIGSEVTLIKKD